MKTLGNTPTPTSDLGEEPKASPDITKSDGKPINVRNKGARRPPDRASDGDNAEGNSSSLTTEQVNVGGSPGGSNVQGGKDENGTGSSRSDDNGAPVSPSAAKNSKEAISAAKETKSGQDGGGVVEIPPKVPSEKPHQSNGFIKKLA